MREALCFHSWEKIILSSGGETYTDSFSFIDILYDQSFSGAGFWKEKTGNGFLCWINELIVGAEKPSEKNCYNY